MTPEVVLRPPHARIGTHMYIHASCMHTNCEQLFFMIRWLVRTGSCFGLCELYGHLGVQLGMRDSMQPSTCPELLQLGFLISAPSHPLASPGLLMLCVQGSKEQQQVTQPHSSVSGSGLYHLMLAISGRHHSGSQSLPTGECRCWRGLVGHAGSPCGTGLLLMPISLPGTGYLMLELKL